MPLSSKMMTTAEQQDIVTKTAMESIIKLLIIVELDRGEKQRLYISQSIKDGIAASNKRSGRKTGCWATISSARTIKYSTAGHIAVWPVITGQSLIYGFYILSVVDQMQIHRIVGTDGIVGCNCICNFTMSFDGFIP